VKKTCYASGGGAVKTPHSMGPTNVDAGGQLRRQTDHFGPF